MVWFSQTNPLWAKELLGYNTDPYYNIANFGCVVTSWANLELATTGNPSCNPSVVNEWMKDHNGFLAGGGIFRWSIALGMGGVTDKGTLSDLGAVNNFLQADSNFAILQVNAPLPGGGFRQHFVLSPYVGKIVDSEDGQVKPQSTYPFVQAHLYTAINMPAPTPPPPPAPTSGALNATVTIRVPLLNARVEPNTTSPVAAVFHQGTAHTLGWTVGQNVTVGGRIDNIWLKSEAGHWFAQAGCDSNFGHAPAKLSAAQSLHLAASTTAGSVMKAFKIRSSKK